MASQTRGNFLARSRTVMSKMRKHCFGFDEISPLCLAKRMGSVRSNEWRIL